MPVAPDAQSLTTAAEQAASNGDFSTAAQYLTLAADLQESGAGSMPVELANTLNNLGVVYDKLDRPAEAERAYRRAYALARAVLPGDHPSVALCETNLRDFCDGRGIPFDPEPARREQATTAPPPVEEGRPVATLPDPSGDPRRPRISAVFMGVAVLVLGALTLLGIRSFGPRPTVETTATSSPPSPIAAKAPATTAAAPVTSPAAIPSPAPALQPEPPQFSATPPPARPEPRRPAGAAVAPAIVVAAVCRSLETRGAEWQCAPPTGEPGTFYFYTRLTVPSPTTVEHRWYRDDRLHQAITLRVAPNSQQGYRTYSRIAIGADRAGAWRAELRSSSGVVLHEEQFAVVR